MLTAFRRRMFSTSWRAALSIAIMAMIMITVTDSILSATVVNAGYIVVCTLEIVALIVFLFYPVIGAWTILVVYWICTIAPVDLTVLASMQTFIAVTVLGYYRMIHGIGSLVFMEIMSIAYRPLVHKPLDTEYFLLMIPHASIYTACMLAGFCIRMIREREKDKANAAIRRRDTQIARDLHDRACNNISYLIQRTNMYLAAKDPAPINENDIEEYRNILRQTLDQLRTGIHALESSSEHFTPPLPSQSTNVILEQESRLASVGLKGHTIYDKYSLSSLPTRMDIFIASLLNELYSNTLKYADPTGGYSASIIIANGTLTISFSNKIKVPNDIKTGTGIAYYEDAIKSAGGSCSVENYMGIWSIHLEIPVNEYIPE